MSTVGALKCRDRLLREAATTPEEIAVELPVENSPPRAQAIVSSQHLRSRRALPLRVEHVPSRLRASRTSRAASMYQQGTIWRGDQRQFDPTGRHFANRFLLPDNQKPSTVWRVEPFAHDNLTSRGFPLFFSEMDFQAQRDRHLDWVKFPSPFISTFSDKTHAINWGRKVLSNSSMLYEIDTQGLQVCFGAQAQPDEYLIVGEVPASNVRHRLWLRGGPMFTSANPANCNRLPTNGLGGSTAESGHQVLGFRYTALLRDGSVMYVPAGSFSRSPWYLAEFGVQHFTEYQVYSDGWGRFSVPIRQFKNT